MFRLFKKKYAYPEVKCPRNAREMTDEEMLLVNGGSERRENSHEGVANANVGDTIERKDGTVVTLNQGDIDYAKAQLGISDSGSGTSVSGSVGNSGSNGNTPSSPSSPSSPTKTNDATANTVKGPDHHSAYDQQYINEMMENARKNALGGSRIQGTAVSGKRIEGQEIKVNPGAGNMTVTEQIEMAKKNAAGNNKFSNTNSGYEIDHYAKAIRTSFNDRNALREAADKFMAYDMEGLGYTFEAYCSDGSCRTYSTYSELYSDIYQQPLHGDLFLTAEIDLVGGLGFEASVSLVLDLDNWKDSGINFSGGVAAGLNVGAGFGIGYTPRDLEGSMPVGVDGNFGYLPFSVAAMTDEKGFNGGSVSFGPGMGLSSSTQKSYTLSINSIIDFFN